MRSEPSNPDDMHDTHGDHHRHEPVAEPYIGCAGWALARALQDEFPEGASHLARYAAVFSAVEINSSFYRPHRRSTYERWAASVPDGFRFAAKLPRTITHERRLTACETLLQTFLDEVGGLGDKLGALLIQLPPTLAFDPSRAGTFLQAFRNLYGGGLCLEPRHPSWFIATADQLLSASRVARVAADPAVIPDAASPGGDADAALPAAARIAAHVLLALRRWATARGGEAADRRRAQRRPHLVHLRQHRGRTRRPECACTAPDPDERLAVLKRNGTTLHVPDNSLRVAHSRKPLRTGKHYDSRRCCKPPAAVIADVFRADRQHRSFAIEVTVSFATSRLRPLLSPLFAIVCIASAAAASRAAASEAAAAPTAQLADCTLPGLSRSARCGSLSVAENPAKPDGRRLSLNIVVVPARNGHALPDPVVFLSGGPGQAATPSAAFLSTTLAAVNEDRDLLLVDQRGTGASAPLPCALVDKADPAANLREIFPLAAVKRCAKTLSARADLWRSPCCVSPTISKPCAWRWVIRR